MTSPCCPFDDGLDGRALAAVLGVDEHTLTTLTGAPVRAAHAISSFRATGSSRQSFRVDLIDGEIRKLRRTLTADDAARMAAKTALLRAGDAARILNVRGNLVVEEWVDGTPLDRGGLSDDVLSDAGALLARIHTAEGIERDEASTASAFDAIRADLLELERAGELSAADAREILSAAAHHDPRTTAGGLIHRDFCAENLVRRSDATLCSIDNEDLRDGSPDADIVRTWQRWDLNGSAREAFLAGYGEWRQPRLDDRAVVFWSIWSRALSARVRASAGDRAASATHVTALIRSADPRRSSPHAAAWPSTNAS